jgi:3-deoxy-D-manno-octulosonic-acid transferase
VVNDIGHLAYLYRYADIAWIGGGFNKTGIHNAIEAAIYGIPVFWGPNYNRYREAVDLIQYNAAISVKNADELLNCILDQDKTKVIQHNTMAYVAQQLGATDRIMNYLEEKCVFNISKNS